MAPMILPDEGRFRLLAHGRHFDAIYQRGDLAFETSEWTRKATGRHYLVVCSCGRGTYSPYLDDAVSALRWSYILRNDGSHGHDESAFPCNIIEAYQDGEHGFILGRIVIPELAPNLHPKGDTSSDMANRNISHVDIPSSNSEQSGKFYHELFGWKITPIPEMNYVVWETEGSRGGFPTIDQDVKAGDVRIYVNSDNVAADLKKARSLGAKVIQEEMEIPGRGWWGVFQDPSGNKIGLFKRRAAV